MIRFQYFPRSSPLPQVLYETVQAFQAKEKNIDSQQYDLNSNAVLSILTERLLTLEYNVELGKQAKDTLPVPVLFGLNNQPSKSFLADAIHKKYKIVIEVEAGRAVANNQFLKDIFQASMMVDVEYLVLAVRNIYRGADDFMKIYSFLDTLYTSQRIQLPLKGILLIGY